MPDTITPNKVYTTGAVYALIDGKTDDEKARIKAQELAKIPLASVASFSYKTYTIKVNSLRFVDDLLEVYVEATKSGNRVAVNNPLLFRNPPIMVPDGTFHYETNSYGEQLLTNNYKEDILAALKEIIGQTIELIK